MSLQHANENSKKAMIAKRISESNLHSFQELEDLFDEFDASNGKALPKKEEEFKYGEKRTTLPIFGEEVPELHFEEEFEITEESLMKLDENVLIELSEEDLEHIYNKDYSFLSEEALQIIKSGIKELSEEGIETSYEIESDDTETSRERFFEEIETQEEENLEEENNSEGEDNLEDEENLDEDDFSTIPENELEENEFEEHNLLGTIKKEETKSKENSSENVNKSRRTSQEEGFREIDEEKIKGFFKNLFKKKEKKSSSKETRIKKSNEESPNKEKNGFFRKKEKSGEEKSPKKGFLKKKINNDKEKSSNVKKIVIITIPSIILIALAFLIITKGSSFKSIEDLEKEGLTIKGDSLFLNIPFPEDDENHTGSILVYLTLEEENEEEIACESDIVDITVGEEISIPMNCNKDLKNDKKYKIKTLESNYF